MIAALPDTLKRLQGQALFQECIMKIGELAKLAGCSVETIRYYECEGLLPRPERGANNYRLYGRSHLEGLRFIRNCRVLEMTLEEIRTLMHLRLDSERDCGEVNAILDEHIAHVTERMESLRSLQDQLVSLRGMCSHVQPRKSCAILLELISSQSLNLGEEQSGRSCVPGAHGGCVKTHDHR
jgi:Cd(II)/Pb(II)-responsive transcriptional regulator